jgi:hypothetical protein
LAVVAAVAGLGSYLTAPRQGGRMDPASTGPDGAHALVTLLRDRGVDVVVADSVADVERESRSDALLLVAETSRLADGALLARLSDVAGDLLLVAPTTRARKALAPAVASRGPATFGHQPDCALQAANRAGRVDFATAETYGTGGNPPTTSCYDGALVRYHDGGRAITVVGSDYFMTNKGLIDQGNAALAMNLAGQRPRLIWYAPQHREAGASGSAKLSELVPDNATFTVAQLALVVALLALWKGRRVGPLVAEELPVVVRASETVEGRGRLYRSRRARDRAAAALRTAALQRLRPRLGLGVNAPPSAVVTAVAQRSGAQPGPVQHLLFGPPPDSDPDLLQLARELDNIERQVSHP